MSHGVVAAAEIEAGNVIELQLQEQMIEAMVTEIYEMQEGTGDRVFVLNRGEDNARVIFNSDESIVRVA